MVSAAACREGMDEAAFPLMHLGYRLAGNLGRVPLLHLASEKSCLPCFKNSPVGIDVSNRASRETKKDAQCYCDQIPSLLVRLSLYSTFFSLATAYSTRSNKAFAR